MIGELEAFIVRAKAETYVGKGSAAEPSRPGSHDLVFCDGHWSYRDSYFGGTDFAGQETVWFKGEPVWSMIYHGFVIRPDLIDAARAGETIRAALSAMYQTGRFLGGFEWEGPHGRYVDVSSGDFRRFQGREHIDVDGVEAYALNYGGGLVIP